MRQTDEQLVLEIKGMTCQGCVRNATNAIQSVPSVATARVTRDPAQATITWNTSADPDAAIAAIKSAGFEATLPNSDLPTPISEFPTWAQTVVLGSAVTALLMLGEWVFRLAHESWFQHSAFILSGIVQIICGARFYAGAWRQLKRGSSNMDTLVSLGSTTAFAFSTWGLLTGWNGHLYFMESAAIISLVSLGHYIESRVSSHAEGALNSLLKLTPETALKRDIDGTEHSVPVADLQPAHEVVLKPGDQIPVDGVVEEGESTVDESMLTGESKPVEKHPGERLFAGTINLDGQLVMQVTATGEATALAQIIKVVERAQNSRANIQRIGDRVSNVFVPIVILIAVATALWWGFAYDHALRTATTILPFLTPADFPGSALEAAFIHLAGVLIIACPCAMGLATPAAIMAGVNAAARRGILIRDGRALEKSGTINTVIFDKTGTLTKGRFTVENTTIHNEQFSPDEINSLAATLTAKSNHPISRALHLAAHPSPVAANVSSLTPKPQAQVPIPAPTEWREHRGHGIEATIDDHTYRLGSINWLEQHTDNGGHRSVVADSQQNRRSGSLQSTTVGLLMNGDLIATFTLRDQLKPVAKEVISNLNANGLTPVMISGDNCETALAIAQEAGIPESNVHAEVLPDQKAKLIESLQAEGHRAAFVGDGINDAPALEQADLGIAVTRASDVAKKSADIILLNSDIQAIPAAIDLAQATLRTIKQNLFWAFFYNCAAIPLAVLGLVSPVICAAAMGLSDLIVIGNALRLLRR